MSESRLGRGLSALIPESKANTQSPFALVSISRIQPAEKQPRSFMDQSSLQELADSIKKSGVIQPIVLKKKDKDGKHEIIAGERRWRAAVIAGVDEIPAVVKDISDKDAFSLSIIENVQRSDLNVLEEALAYKRLMHEFLYTHEEIACIVGKSRSHVTNIIRVLMLPELVQKALVDQVITLGHAKILVKAEDSIEVLDKIIRRNLNVRQAEMLVASSRQKERLGVESSGKNNDNVSTLAKTLSDRLGIKVRIEEGADERGVVKLFYQDSPTLERILKYLTELSSCQ